MKILHLCSDYGIFHVNLFNSLDSKGVSSVPVAYKLRAGAFRQLKKSYKSTIFVGSKVNFFRTPVFHSIRSRIAFNNVFARTGVNYSLVHAHMLFSDGFLAYQFYKEAGLNYIVAVRNSDVNNSILWKIPYLVSKVKEVVNNASAIIFISPGHKSLLINRLGKEYADVIKNKSYVIPNGVDDFWLDNMSNGKELLSKVEFNLVTVGDICENKNQLLTAQHIQKFNFMQHDYKLNYWLIGKVVDKKIKNKLMSYPFVNYLGVMEKEDIVEQYRKMDIFVLISSHETFGLVYPEAMTQSLPLVYTKGQGIDGYYKDGKIGYPIFPSSYIEFEKAVLSIVSNYNIISKSALKVSSSFDWELIADKYIHLYSMVLKVTKSD